MPERLIDAEAFEKHIMGSKVFSQYFKELVQSLIWGENTVDAVRVVRCKDCQSFRPYPKPVEDFDGFCIQRGCETDEKEFCSYPVNKREYDAKMDEEEKQ